MTKKPKKIRLDELLVEQGVFPDAGTVLRAVLAHEVKVDDVYVTSAEVAPDAEIVVRGRKQFVSRGGHKLQGALDAFGQDVQGLNCIDVGSSTGGFTDCLLQAGAAHVACVDVNYGQLAWKIRTDERVSVFERTNIKLADPGELGAPFDLIVCDVSFIGLAVLAPAFARLSRPASDGASASVFLGLVKPQFESRHDETDHGIVRDEAVRARTVEEVRCALEREGDGHHRVADQGCGRECGIPRPRSLPRLRRDFLWRGLLAGDLVEPSLFAQLRVLGSSAFRVILFSANCNRPKELA